MTWLGIILKWLKKKKKSNIQKKPRGYMVNSLSHVFVSKSSTFREDVDGDK